MNDDQPTLASPSPQARKAAAPAPPAARSERRKQPRGLSLLAVLPADGDEPEWDPVDPKLGSRLVLHDDVAALVAPAPPQGADDDPLHVTARHWEVHRALLAGDVGFRTEIDMYMGPNGGEVTTPNPQRAIYPLFREDPFA